MDPEIHSAEALATYSIGVDGLAVCMAAHVLLRAQAVLRSALGVQGAGRAREHLDSLRPEFEGRTRLRKKI